jgi:hypothetical protein
MKHKKTLANTANHYKISDVLPVKIRTSGKQPGIRKHKKMYEGIEARTTFEALMFKLCLPMQEWSMLCDISCQRISVINKGVHIATVPVAKRMQEEARKLGVVVTLDELYQSVLPWG